MKIVTFHRLREEFGENSSVVTRRLLVAVLWAMSEVENTADPHGCGIHSSFEMVIVAMLVEELTATAPPTHADLNSS